jgi:hypothetical protein
MIYNRESERGRLARWWADEAFASGFDDCGKSWGFSPEELS